MSEKRHHTKLKREELVLLHRYDLDELAFQTGAVMSLEGEED